VQEGDSMSTMRERIISISALATAACLGVGVDTAHAEPETTGVALTVLSGVTMQVRRPAIGGAVGYCLESVCVETEYARTFENSVSRAPAVSTLGFRFLVLFRSPVQHIKLYGVYGVGMHLEKGRYANEGVNEYRNLGGGGLLTLAGPLELRLEYRLLILRGLDHDPPFQWHPQYLSTGLTVSF
jgi:hypothetical protein